MKLSRNALIFSITTSLVAVGVYAYLFLGLRDTAQEHAQITAELEQEEQKQERRGSVSAILEDTEEERAELESIFVTEETIVDFFEEFEVLRGEAGVEAEIDQVREDIELEIEEDDEGEKGEEGEEGDDGDDNESAVQEILSYVEMDVSAEGSWGEVFRFLSLIETMPYAMELRNVHISENEAPQSSTDEEGGPVPTSSTWDLAFTIRVLNYDK